MMVIAARRHERRRVTELDDLLEADEIRVEAQRRRRVRDVQVQVPHTHARRAAPRRICLTTESQ